MSSYPNRPSASRVTHARLWKFLTELDEEVASAYAKKGCIHCGHAALCRRDYPRAAWGLPTELGAQSRISYCCADKECGRRTTPPSVRYFGRRFYVGPLFLLMSVMQFLGKGTLPRFDGGNPPIRKATLRRWRRWWQEEFCGTAHWRRLRPELPPRSPDREPLLFLVLDHAARQGGLTRKVVRALIRFRPWERAHGSTPVHCGRIGGRE